MTRGADLTSARLDGANPRGAELDKAILNRTRFSPQLREASLSGTFIRHVVMDRDGSARPQRLTFNVAWDRLLGQMVEFDDADELRLARFHDVVEERAAVAFVIAANAKRVS